MMPRKADVLPQDDLPVVAQRMPRGGGAAGLVVQVAPDAAGSAQVPALIRPVAEPCAESRTPPLHLRRVPILRSRRERGVLHLGGVFQFPEVPENGDAARVARTPEDREARVSG